MLKTADQIIMPALERLYQLRPRSFKHLNDRTGIYWHVFAAHRAQAASEIQRVAGLCRANSLNATGQDLIDYIASEYTDVPAPAGNFAIGEVTFTRPFIEGSLGGDIRKGARITREADITGRIPFAYAQYETLEDVHFEPTQLTAGPVAIRALTATATSNHPLRTDTAALQISTAGVFDPTIVIDTFSAAGGVDAFATGLTGDDETFLREYARAYSTGQYGPSQDESRFGALQASGVRHTVIYDDVPSGSQRILIADKSWAGSQRWATNVEQNLYDADHVGFGCQVIVVPVRNKIIAVQAKVVLRDWNYTKETSAVDAGVRVAISAYFDSRPDWNIWKYRGLRNAIGRAHPKILNCPDARVLDVTGFPLAEIATADYTVEQFHYYASGVTCNYVGPS